MKNRFSKLLPLMAFTGSFFIWGCGEPAPAEGIQSRQKGDDCDKEHLCLDGLFCEDGKCRVLCSQNDECGPKEHCENSRCVVNLSDACPDGFGGKDGKDCNSCLKGYYGDLCEPCTCQHGECWDGKSGTGLCKGTCAEGWDGPNCDKCADGYATKDCIAVTCKNGTPNQGLEGDGHCASCDGDWSGTDCDITNNCVHGTVNKGIQGDGHCASCDEEWSDTDCDTCPKGYFDGVTGCIDCRKIADVSPEDSEKCTYTDNRTSPIVKYKVVTIGEQLWMAQNLAYADSEADITCLASTDITKGGVVDFIEKYGCLYTWKNALKVCPEGWRLPTEDEFRTLLAQTGADKDSSAIRANIWKIGSDVSGFGVLPAGYYSQSTGPTNLSDAAYIWSSTSEGDNYTKYLLVAADYAEVLNGDPRNAFSVRCIKDSN